MKVPNKFANQIMKGRYGASNLLYMAVNLWMTLIGLHSVPNGMKSQTWNFFRLLRNIQIHQQTKGLILIFYYQFNQVAVIKSEEITNISSKFSKNTVQSANSLDLILKIT